MMKYRFVTVVFAAFLHTHIIGCSSDQYTGTSYSPVPSGQDNTRLEETKTHNTSDKTDGLLVDEQITYTDNTQHEDFMPETATPTTVHKYDDHLTENNINRNGNIASGVENVHIVSNNDEGNVAGDGDMDIVDVGSDDHNNNGLGLFRTSDGSINKEDTTSTVGTDVDKDTDIKQTSLENGKVGDAATIAATDNSIPADDQSINLGVKDSEQDSGVELDNIMNEDKVKEDDNGIDEYNQNEITYDANQYITLDNADKDFIKSAANYRTYPNNTLSDVYRPYVPDHDTLDPSKDEQNMEEGADVYPRRVSRHLDRFYGRSHRFYEGAPLVQRKVTPGMFQISPCEMWMGPGITRGCCRGMWYPFPVCLCLGFNMCSEHMEYDED